jgi:hypothetical protein
VPHSYVRCRDCGKVTPMDTDDVVLSHDCPVTGVIKTVRADGTRVNPDEMDPRTLGFPYVHRGGAARSEGRG